LYRIYAYNEAHIHVSIHSHPASLTNPLTHIYTRIRPQVNRHQ